MLPEDLGFIGVTESELEATIPGIFAWLEKVFSVMGGYIFTSGLLILYIAATSPRRRATDAAVLAVAGLTSIGWMAVVNFIINSDFKWLILAFFLPWVIALGLYRLERR